MNYSTGDCDIYAIALHRLYKYPIYVVNGYYIFDDEYCNEPCHLVVKLPNGNFLDSRGETTEEELKEDSLFSNEIKYIKIEEISEDEAMFIFTSDDQEELIQKTMEEISLNEKITLDIEKGDTLLGGKFKNKKVVVKKIDKNDKGDITINGKPLLKFRILKKFKDFNEKD